MYCHHYSTHRVPGLRLQLQRHTQSLSGLTEQREIAVNFWKSHLLIKKWNKEAEKPNLTFEDIFFKPLYLCYTTAAYKTHCIMCIYFFFKHKTFYKKPTPGKI